MHAPLLYTDFKKLSRKNLKNSLRSPGFSLMTRPDRLSCVYSPVQNMSTVASAKRVPFSSVTTERRMEMVFPLRIISPFAVTTPSETLRIKLIWALWVTYRLPSARAVIPVTTSAVDLAAKVQRVRIHPQADLAALR